jgi:hypothetical protein
MTLEGLKNTEMRTESMDDLEGGSGTVTSGVCVPKDREHDLVPELGDTHTVEECPGLELCLELAVVLVWRFYPQREEMGDPR